jgi:two-component system cell cycle response regulator DivK
VAALVLIVDDDERNARLARDVLEAAGFRTAVAATAAEALAAAHEKLPDVVLMDLRLPDLDGGEAVRRLAADDRTAAIPVLAVSALRRDDADPWWRDAGFADYVEKPIDVLALPGRVRAALQPGQPP